MSRRGSGRGKGLPKRRVHRPRYFLVALASFFLLPGSAPADAQESTNPNVPVVSKVEPPNWWVGLTPELLLLLSGKNLEATHASCNLPEVVVSRTQSSPGGSYLFMWLKFAPGLKSGTAVCRILTTHGEASFELPITARKQRLGRN